MLGGSCSSKDYPHHVPRRHSSRIPAACAGRAWSCTGVLGVKLSNTYPRTNPTNLLSDITHGDSVNQLLGHKHGSSVNILPSILRPYLSLLRERLDANLAK